MYLPVAFCVGIHAHHDPPIYRMCIPHFVCIIIILSLLYRSIVVREPGWHEYVYVAKKSQSNGVRTV